MKIRVDLDEKVPFGIDFAPSAKSPDLFDPAIIPVTDGKKTPIKIISELITFDPTMSDATYGRLLIVAFSGRFAMIPDVTSLSPLAGQELGTVLLVILPIRLFFSALK